MEQHFRAIAAGQPILKPFYDHADGTFGPPEYVEPKEFVVIEGLLPLESRALRDTLDVKVFLDPEEELRRRWKVQRDCAGRGYTPEQVLAELERREPDSARFIRPQRAPADIVVRFHRQRPDAGHLGARMALRPTLPHPELEGLVASLQTGGYEPIRLFLERDLGKPAEILEIEGDCPPDIGRDVEEAIWHRM
jgi:phosphoribulokinase